VKRRRAPTAGTRSAAPALLCSGRGDSNSFGSLESGVWGTRMTDGVCDD
jgi:hypothetical protein